MKAGWILLALATLWLAIFGSAPGRAVTLPMQVEVTPPR